MRRADQIEFGVGAVEGAMAISIRNIRRRRYSARRATATPRRTIGAVATCASSAPSKSATMCDSSKPKCLAERGREQLAPLLVLRAWTSRRRRHPTRSARSGPRRRPEARRTTARERGERRGRSPESPISTGQPLGRQQTGYQREGPAGVPEVVTDGQRGRGCARLEALEQRLDVRGGDDLTARAAADALQLPR